MSDVFVSYKAEDRRRVKPLVEALQAEGFSVWWDEQIGGGAAWRQSIETELNAAKCVVVVWSKRSIGPDGTFVRDEATRAQQRHVYVPVLIDKVHLPLGFGETQALPLTGWRGDRSDPRFQAVLAAAKKLAGDRDAAVAARGPHVDRRLVLGGGAVAAAAVLAGGGWLLLRSTSAKASDSIAVLPFANLSGDPSQAYFSDGIAEELRSALARVTGLKVVGRTSSEAVRNEDAETAAKKLGVVNVLTGSVRRSPSTIRVSAQLIDGSTGLERWSQNYDRAPGDSIQIQTDIATNVATSLKAALGGAVRAALAVGGTTNADAQNLALQANELTNRETRKADEHAIELLDAAIALDPTYAFAYGLKAITLLGLYNAFASGSKELQEGRAQALALARKSIAIAPDLAIGHGAIGIIYAGNLHIAPALVEYKKAMSLAPSSPDAIRSYCSFLVRLGRFADALRLADQAVQLDPLNGGSYGQRASALYYARRYSEAASSLEELKRNSPRVFESPITLGTCLMMAGRIADAARSFADAPPDDPFLLASRAVLGARTGDRATAMQEVQRLQQLYADAASYQFAQIYSQLGDRAAALSHLEHGWDIKDAGMLWMKVDPWLDPLRSEPRFAAVMAKMDFPAA